MRYPAALAGTILLLSVLPAAAQSPEGGRAFGISATGSVAGAPIGQIAERTGLYAVPGLELIRASLGIGLKKLF